MTEFKFTCTHKKHGYTIELVYVNKTERGARGRCTKALNELYGNAAMFTIVQN